MKYYYILLLCIIHNCLCQLNFTKIMHYDLNCLNHYNKYVSYVINSNNESKYIPFNEYLEYWWDLDETEDDR